MSNELLNKRIEVLNQIDELLHLCNCTSDADKSKCSNCEKVKALGDKLATLVRPRVKTTFHDYGDKNCTGVKKRRVLKMSMDEYLTFLDKGLTTLQIAEIKGFDKSTVDDWKRKNRDELISLGKMRDVK